MKKFLRKHIGFKSTTNEGYQISVVDGGSKNGYCTILLDGIELEVQFNAIKNGKIKNRSHPSVYGKGFIGYGIHRPIVNGKTVKAYKTWCDMLARCYYNKCQEKQPTYIGCCVCDEWLNFQVFADWFYNNYVEGFALDKDIMINGNKIYSPECCKFVSQAENNIKAQAKKYSFINPQGNVIEIYNLAEFCRENNLNKGNMSAVHLGKRKTNKQWRKA